MNAPALIDHIETMSPDDLRRDLRNAYATASALSREIDMLHRFRAGQAERLNERVDTIATQAQTISDLMTAQRWIPVTEQPMPVGPCVLVVADGAVTLGWRQGNGHCYTADARNHQEDYITHWRPLPPLPEEPTP